MNPLRVLHLNSLLRGGGTDDRSVRIAHALLRMGHQVWLAGPRGFEYSEVARKLEIPFCPASPGRLKLLFILRIAWVTWRKRIQILHARHGRDYWPAIFAARLSPRRPKVVLSRHLAKSPSSWFSRHFLLNRCDAMVAVSHFVAKVMIEGDADPLSDNPERHCRPPLKGDHSRIHVVYGGFDMDQFQPRDATAQRQAWGLKEGDYAFGLVGGYSLPRGKGHPEFLQAAAQVYAGNPQARFLIIGRGNMRDQLEREIEQIGLKSVAWLTPYCQTMPVAMNAIDCLVLPQVGTEALPGVVCEAHACGKPVIASDLDGIPEAFNVGRYGELVTAGSVPQLAAAMDRWAVRPPLDLAARMELHRKVAGEFSLEVAARRLTELYNTVLGLKAEHAGLGGRRG